MPKGRGYRKVSRQKVRKFKPQANKKSKKAPRNYYVGGLVF